MMRTFLLACATFFMCLVLSGNVYAKRYGSKICESPEYTCYTAKKGDTWAKLFPDETERDIIKRINRMNVPLPRGTKIAIPVMFGTDFMDHAPFPDQDDATGNKYIVISLSKLAFGAYDEDGVLQYWGPISPGKNYCSDVRRGCRTPTGTFAIYSKRGAGCKSSKYPLGKGGAPMPYCMFFHKGYAMHGAKQVPGYPASHGCIRMKTVDAKWLSNTFTAGVSKVPVIISK